MERDAVLEVLKTNLQKAQQRMKEYADKHRREVVFQIGDWVYVKIQPFRQSSLHLQCHHKLGRRYFGPYQILARIGSVAYKLDLPEEAKIHNVFHVSLLKKCVGKPLQQVTPLDLIDSSVNLIVQPKNVLEERTIWRSGQQIVQWRVQWEGLAAADATWEDKASIVKSFPTLHLEDKVGFKGGGNVVKQVDPNERMSQEPKETVFDSSIDPEKRNVAAAPRKNKRESKIPIKLGDYVLN